MTNHLPDAEAGAAISATATSAAATGATATSAPAASPQALLASVQSIARKIAAVHADDVDRRNRFPAETFDALKAAGVLSAPVPRALGGAGCTMRELGAICSALAQACGSSGMVLAMHYIQVACLTRHTAGEPWFDAYLARLVDEQLLLGSVTSEIGTGGDTRRSLCAVRIENGRFAVSKAATTVSYAIASDALLITCRRNADAAENDQVMVFATREGLELKQTSDWDSMGMRGTCSPGFQVEASGEAAQIVPVSYADMSAQTMVPYSHILWSSVWHGIAAGAIARAGTFVRGDARRNPGTVPPMAARLAKASAMLQSMRNNWLAAAIEFDDVDATPDAAETLSTIAWALKMNQLKVTNSELAPEVVHRALQITGILGYKNDTPFSVGRHYRDALSASLMIANERIAAKSASMLLVFKDD